MPRVLLPIAIAFATFTNSAHAYDCYDGKSDDCTLEYSRFPVYCQGLVLPLVG
jgi:hypothetical protein